MSIIQEIRDADPYKLWKGETDNQKLDQISFGVRAGVAAVATLILMFNAKAPALTGIIVGGSVVGAEAISVIRFRENADTTVKDFNSREQGFTPILRGVAGAAALYSLGSLGSAMFGGGASLGKIVGSLATLGGTVGWNAFLLDRRTVKESATGEELKLVDRAKELVAFPKAPVEASQD